MISRKLLVLAAAAGSAGPAFARQDLMRVSYSYTEVWGNTTIPVTTPNGILDPGEGALIGITLYAMINGASAIGQTTNYTPPPPPGVGTVRGIGSFLYTLNVSGSTPEGQWAGLAVSPLLNIANQFGTPASNGASVTDFGGGQFLTPGDIADETNPIAYAWSGVWTPSSYAFRSLNFKATFSQIAGAAECSGFTVNTGIGYLDPADPSTAYPIYINKYVDTDFGAGVTVSVVPSPCAAVILGALGLGRRRR